jgi:hypothetical protein
MMPFQQKNPFQEKGWLYELLQVGARALCEVERSRVNLYSRQLLPFGKKYPDIAAALGNFQHEMLLDGEIVKERAGPVHRIFDLLFLDGKDLRKEPLSARKSALKKLKIFGGPLEFVEHCSKWEDLVTQEECTVLARYADSPYQSGVSRSWAQFELRSASLKASPKKRDEPVFSNLDKIYWLKEGIKKGNVIDYYREVSNILLTHLKDRPQSLHRHPDGIAKAGFFQKDMTGYLPRWIHIHRLFSESAGKLIDYFLWTTMISLKS